MLKKHILLLPVLKTVHIFAETVTGFFFHHCWPQTLSWDSGNKLSVDSKPEETVEDLHVPLILYLMPRGRWFPFTWFWIVLTWTSSWIFHQIIHKCVSADLETRLLKVTHTFLWHICRFTCNASVSAPNQSMMILSLIQSNCRVWHGYVSSYLHLQEYFNVIIFDSPLKIMFDLQCGLCTHDWSGVGVISWDTFGHWDNLGKVSE